MYHTGEKVAVLSTSVTTRIYH